MFSKIKFLLVLMLPALACLPSVELPSVELPETELKTGPTVVEEINIGFPDTESVDLSLLHGAGILDIRPGAENSLVEGKISYNVEDFKPVIEENGDQVSLSMGEMEFSGIPAFDESVINDWELRLGSVPLNLKINAGAYLGNVDLGGLSILNLEIEDAAADSTVDFSSPNLTEMGILDYQTGASSIELLHLGNANFSSMVFFSGAGDYKLDLSGDWQRNANIKIETGLSNVTIRVPAGLNVKLTFDGGLSNVTTYGEWSANGDTYTHPGEGITVTITLDMAAGNLTLETIE